MTPRIRRALSHRHQQLIRWLQRLHAERPGLHLAMVAAAAAAGAGVLAAPALAVLAAGADLLAGGLAPVHWGLRQWLEAGIGLGGAGLLAVQVRMRHRPPEGVRVSARAAPALHEEIERVRRHLRAGTLAAVHVDEQPRVALVRQPHPLLPLLHRNLLVIGLPVLAAHGPDTFRAELARALGEISAHNLGLSGWLYRLRHSWVLYRAAIGRCRGGWLLARWMDGFAPFYSRITQPMGEAAALQGDRLAALVVDEEVVVEAICRQELLQSFLEEYYWPRIHKSAERHPEPRFRPYAHLPLLMRRKLDRARGLRWLRAAWSRSEGGRPSSFRRRLEALGQVEPRWAPNPVESAAERYFPRQRLDAVVARLDVRWMERERENWRIRYETAHQGRDRMALLRRRLEAGRLSVREALEYAALCRRHAAPEAARAAYDTLLSLHPEAPEVLYAVGKHYVTTGDPHGVKLLERAMEKDSRYVQNACLLIADFVRRSGTREVVSEYVRQKLRTRQGVG